MENLFLLVSEEDRTIYVNDAREYFKGCIPGWNRFAEIHNLDWKSVMRNGLKASYLLSLDDAMATNLVRYVYERG